MRNLPFDNQEEKSVQRLSREYKTWGTNGISMFDDKKLFATEVAT